MSKSDSQSSSPVETTEQYFRRVLNAHGYPFQFAVIRRAQVLRQLQYSKWVFESSEIPVGTSGRSTHVDFVFRDYRGRDNGAFPNLYLIAECKRVDPSKAIWCFVRNPYPMRNAAESSHPVQFDRIISKVGEERYVKDGLIKHWGSSVFELPFQLRSSQPNDPLSPLARSPINDAAYQVLLGQQGFISHLTSLKGVHEQEQMRRENVFVPVVFTTAELFVSDVDLGDSDIYSGEITKDLKSMQKVNWLWYNYRRPSDLGISLEEHGRDLTHYDRYFAFFTRSIAFVSVSGIDEFLTIDFSQWLSD